MKELLIELQNECIELAGAGSDLSIGNFKLEKLLPKFEKIGEKAKPFKIVSERINALLNSSKEQSEDNLIALSSLVNAILLTQADTDIEGEIEIPEGFDGDINTNTSNRIIAPVMESLTTIGGGRYNIIENAIKEGLFSDSRLLPLLIKGLDDKYVEIGELIYKKLSSDNHPELLPIFKENFNRNGKRGDVFKLDLIGKILGECGRDLYIDLLEDSSREVKVEAVTLLGNLKDTEEIILEQSKSKVKELKKAAYSGLLKINSEGAKKELINAIKKQDYIIVLEEIAKQNKEICAEVLLEGLKDTYLKKIKKESESSYNEKMNDILNEMKYHKSQEILEFLLQCIEEDKISDWSQKLYARNVFVERRLVECLAEYENIPIKTLELLESRKGRNDNRILDIVFRISLKYRTSEEMYEMYSSYFADKTVDKGIKEDMLESFSEYLGYKPINHIRNGFYETMTASRIESMIKPVNKKFDRQWIETFKKCNAYSIIAYTLEKEDTDTVKYMIDNMNNFNRLEKENKSRFGEFLANLMYALIGLIKIEYEEAYKVVADRAKATTGYDIRRDQILLLIPYLPQSYKKEIEEFLVELKDKDVYLNNVYLEMRAAKIKEALDFVK